MRWVPGGVARTARSIWCRVAVTWNARAVAGRLPFGRTSASRLSDRVSRSGCESRVSSIAEIREIEMDNELREDMEGGGEHLND